jgi:ribonuclease III
MRQEDQALPSLEASLGYGFRNRTWLSTALTPPSCGLNPNNQRLEFLGDAILQVCVSELIFREKPSWDEGAMSKLRGMLVCTQSLCEWAQDLGLQLGTGPRSAKKAPAPGGRKPKADAMEALIAAVFLDARSAGEDPLAAVASIVASRFQEQIGQAGLGAWEERDSKTTLQERTALLALPVPIYELVEKGGPEHAPVFTARVRVGTLEATATAGTLKRAQMDAARELLKHPRLGKR